MIQTRLIIAIGVLVILSGCGKLNSEAAYFECDFATTFSASGTQLNLLTLDGGAASLSETLTFNSPWTGFGTPSSGGVGLLAGTGVYVLEAAGGYAEIGVKLN